MPLSHDKRRERRQRMAKAVASGQAVEKVAVRFGVSPSLVELACREHSVDYPRRKRGRPAGVVDRAAYPRRKRGRPLGAVDREKERLRKKVAQFVATGRTIHDAVFRFGLSSRQVRDYCAREGVSPNRPRDKSLFRLIAALINTDASYTTISRKLGITTSRIGQVAQLLDQVGIAMHPAREERRRGPGPRRHAENQDGPSPKTS